MGLISPGGENLLDFLELRKVLSTYDGNLYAEYIMKHAGMEDTWAGMKIAGRNINKLRYADLLSQPWTYTLGMWDIH